MRFSKDQSTDGRPLMRVTFTPPHPDPARALDIEVVFEMRGSGPSYLFELVSSTRTDTREAVHLTVQQKESLLDALNEHLINEDDSPLWGAGRPRKR